MVVFSCSLVTVGIVALVMFMLVCSNNMGTIIGKLHGFNTVIVVGLLQVVLMLMTVLLIHTPGVVVLFRYIHSSTPFLQYPMGSSQFMSKANLCLVFVAALLMCVFQACLLLNAFCRLIHTVSVCFLCWNQSLMLDMYLILRATFRIQGTIDYATSQANGSVALGLFFALPFHV